MISKITAKFSKVVHNVREAMQYGGSISLKLAFFFIAIFAVGILLAIFVMFPRQVAYIMLLASVSRILYAAFTSK